MFRRTSWAWLPALAAGWLAAAAAAAAEGPPIKDDAGLFSPAAVQKASAEIEGIERAEHKQLVIETFKGVPQDKAKAFGGMSKRARDDFFYEWADERAQARQVDGVYVLLCKSPPHTAVVLGPGTEERVFPERDRETLAETLWPGGWRSNHDKELLKAVSWFHSTLHRNLRAGGPEDAARTWPWVLGSIAGLLLLWGALVVAGHVVDLLGHRPAADADPAEQPETTAPAPPDDDTELRPVDSGPSDLERRAEDF